MRFGRDDHGQRDQKEDPDIVGPASEYDDCDAKAEPNWRWRARLNLRTRRFQTDFDFTSMQGLLCLFKGDPR